jgi:lipopolysaccharide transport system ATP-binding protein
MSLPHVTVSHLSKAYSRSAHSRNLRETLQNMAAAALRRRSDAARTSYALDDVSFEVQSGEVVGIIGHNGAGKSTLLKILSRVTEPTAGRAEIRGRVGSLLEVGTGFHSELSGRENIYLSAAILGMSRADIDKKFDQIVSFAEIPGGHLDIPVKRYSSGMYVRLGFAVASHLEPDILLIDEVLSVGDMAFQRKCLQRIGSLTRQARAILLVTHNMMSVRGICGRVLLLSRGRMVAQGTPDAVIPEYERLTLAGETDDAAAVEQDRGTGQIQITRLTLLASDGVEQSSFEMGSPVRVRIDYHVEGEVTRPVAYAGVRKPDGFICTGTSTEIEGTTLPALSGEGTLELDLSQLSVTPGMYVMDVTFYDENFEHRTYFLGRRRMTFHVDSPLGVLDDRYGVFQPKARWNLRPAGTT